VREERGVEALSRGPHALFQVEVRRNVDSGANGAPDEIARRSANNATILPGAGREIDIVAQARASSPGKSSHARSIRRRRARRNAATPERAASGYPRGVDVQRPNTPDDEGRESGATSKGSRAAAGAMRAPSNAQSESMNASENASAAARLDSSFCARRSRRRAVHDRDGARSPRASAFVFRAVRQAA
jgi:hypothetical protein